MVIIDVPVRLEHSHFIFQQFIETSVHLLWFSGADAPVLVSIDVILLAWEHDLPQTLPSGAANYWKESCSKVCLGHIILGSTVNVSCENCRSFKCASTAYMLADHYPRYVRVYRSFSVNNTSINDHMTECICPHTKKTNLGTQLLRLYGSCERFLCSKVKFDIPWDT